MAKEIFQIGKITEIESLDVLLNQIKKCSF